MTQETTQEDGGTPQQQPDPDQEQQQNPGEQAPGSEPEKKEGEAA
jgi:hypothetical protein